MSKSEIKRIVFTGTYEEVLNINPTLITEVPKGVQFKYRERLRNKR